MQSYAAGNGRTLVWWFDGVILVWIIGMVSILLAWIIGMDLVLVYWQRFLAWYLSVFALGAAFLLFVDQPMQPSRSGEQEQPLTQLPSGIDIEENRKVN